MSTGLSLDVAPVPPAATAPRAFTVEVRFACSANRSSPQWGRAMKAQAWEAALPPARRPTGPRWNAAQPGWALSNDAGRQENRLEVVLVDNCGMRLSTLDGPVRRTASGPRNPPSTERFPA